MFDSLFSLDSPLGRTLSTLTDILILNLLFVLCCLPVITIGASWTALYSVMRKLIRDEDGHIVRGFFAAFRRSFKQSTILWLILAVFGGALIASLMATVRLEMVALNRVLLVILLLYGVELSYIFPLVSQFDAPAMSQLRNALLIGIANLPWTVLVLLIDLCPVLLMITQTRLLLVVPPVMLLIGFGLVAFCGSFIFNHVFKRYVLAAQEQEEA